MKSILLFFSLFYIHLGHAEFQVPKIQRHVNDYAKLIHDDYENKINHLLAAVKKESGVEMAILTVESLHGETIEQASIQVADRWQLGTAKEDKGLLLFITKRERQIRLDVGQGLEGEIPDAYAKRIIDDNIVPLFKTGQVSEGVLLGVYQSIKLAAPQFPLDNYLQSNNFTKSPANNHKTHRWWVIIFWLLFILIFSRNPFLAYLLLSRGSRNGSWRGSGWGGGGSWGGGGGFSGGGASGRW